MVPLTSLTSEKPVSDVGTEAKVSGEQFSSLNDKVKDLSTCSDSDIIFLDRDNKIPKSRSPIKYLLPPPLASYPSYESLQEAIRIWTKDQGYELVVSRSYNHNSKIIRRYLDCGRAGKSQNNRKLTEYNRRRKTSSHKTGCTMGVYAIADNRENPEGSWSIKYKTTERSKIHNHDAGFGIANHRRYDRNDSIVSEIQNHIQCGISTAQSRVIIRENFPDTLQTSQDIQNLRYRARKGLLKPIDSKNIQGKPTAYTEEHANIYAHLTTYV